MKKLTISTTLIAAFALNSAFAGNQNPFAYKETPELKQYMACIGNDSSLKRTQYCDAQMVKSHAKHQSH